MKDKYIIKCPYCGAEYTPAEIYIPKDFFSDEVVVKDDKGKIQLVTNSLLNTKETYCCDNCLKEFSVNAEVSFTVEEVKDEFDEDSVTTIHTDLVNLEE